MASLTPSLSSPFCLLLIAYCPDARMSTTLKFSVIEPILNGVALHLQWLKVSQTPYGAPESSWLSNFLSLLCSLFPSPPLHSSSNDFRRRRSDDGPDEIRKMADAEPAAQTEGGRGREREREMCVPRCERVWFSMSRPFFRLTLTVSCPLPTTSCSVLWLKGALYF